MLSLCIPYHDAARYLPPLLESLSTLPVDRVELVFVDDGSSDDGPRRVAEFASRRANCALVRHESNRGLGAACNTAIAHARGEFMQRCDADDLPVAAGLLAALTEAERRGLDLVLQPYVEVKWDGREVRREPRARIPGERFVEYYWRTWYGVLWAIMVRTEVARRVKFLEDVRLGADALWMAEVASEIVMGRVGFTDVVSYRWIRRPGSASQATDERQAEHAEAKLARLGHMETIGNRLVAAGLLSEAQMRRALVEHACGRFLAALRKSGQYSRAVHEFRRLRRDFGVSREMRLHLLRSLPGAVWERLAGARRP